MSPVHLSERLTTDFKLLCVPQHLDNQGFSGQCVAYDATESMKTPVYLIRQLVHDSRFESVGRAGSGSSIGESIRDSASGERILQLYLSHRPHQF
ncbi:hypothetical protein PHLCEN_2v11777 [Hermanssonia centrifuga]|uniref:Uncharacterized protein n=1 Tax=Hermanssonia centrifuga TaxID=98765 RepID=A0A2R6NIY3_9APHY|nr:hypothetical protein PHLCEN_2v11777 [Hermanssonia centrifuga]